MSDPDDSSLFANKPDLPSGIECPACGAANFLDTTFCTDCGLRLRFDGQDGEGDPAVQRRNEPPLAKPGRSFRIGFWACWLILGPFLLLAVFEAARYLSRFDPGDTLAGLVLAGVAAAISVTLLVVTRGYLRCRAWQPTRCFQCGYILFGLPQSRCPECGSAFDPDAFEDAERDGGRDEEDAYSTWWPQAPVPATPEDKLYAAGVALSYALLVALAVAPGAEDLLPKSAADAVLLLTTSWVAVMVATLFVGLRRCWRARKESLPLFFWVSAVANVGLFVLLAWLFE